MKKKKSMLFHKDSDLVTGNYNIYTEIASPLTDEVGIVSSSDCFISS